MLPNFFVLGAAKCGTTALYHYLKQHPQIFMCPIKEPGFFALTQIESEFQQVLDHAPKACIQESTERYQWFMKKVRDLAAYSALYDGVANETAIGEASPFYLYWPGTAKCIRQYVPDAKLIAILRDPVERAYSAFAHYTRLGIEPFADFRRALRAEDITKRNPCWGHRHYLRQGFYAEQLKPYYATFDRSRIKVYLYDDLKADAAGLMQDIYRFLEVDDTFVPQVAVKHNVGKFPERKALHSLLSKSNPVRKILKPFLPAKMRAKMREFARHLRNRNMRGAKPGLSPEIRRELLTVFRDDILQLQDLIQRDLSGWLEETKRRGPSDA